MNTNFFLPYQERWIDDEAPFKLYEKSRRIGATFSTSYRCFQKCMRRKKGFIQWVSSRDMLTAQEFIRDYIAKWCGAANIIAKGMYGEDVQAVGEGDVKAFVVEFPTGCRIVSLASTPEVFAGKGGDVLLDECDLHRDFGHLIDMAMPCITWGGQLEAVSAYAANGSPDTAFAKLVSQAKFAGNPMGAALHRTTIDDAIAEGLVEKIVEQTGKHQTREEFRTILRARCRTEAEWQSQYMCNPQDEGGALLAYNLISSCEADTSLLQTAHKAEGPCYLGADIGRDHDRTVLWVLRKVGDVYWTVEIVVLDKTPFRDQLLEISRVMREWNIRRACIDATGIGRMLAEEARRLHGTRVEEVKFTAAVKEDLLLPLQRAFQDRAIRVPADQEIREDLHKIRQVKTSSGNIRLDADSDDSGHADRAIALALAHHAGSANGSPTFIPREFPTSQEETL
jgi:phage FluMu gp28-like protein